MDLYANVLAMRRIVVGVLLVALVAGSTPAWARWHPHMRDAVRYAESRQTSFSIAVIGRDGERYRHRSHTTHESVSVLKTILMVAYLRLPAVRDRRLRESDRDLLAPMIKRSDNATASRIRDIVGHRRLRRLARKADMRRFRIVRPWGLSQITAADMADFMYRIERYIPKRHEDYARYLLGHVVSAQRWGIGRLALGPWKVFFKSGWGSGTGRWSHQVAWIERGRDRLSFAVLTEFSPNHRYSIRTLRGIFRRLLRGLPGKRGG
jgi:Beta-lactamase enzyme family